jgi:hypothetical protein
VREHTDRLDVLINNAGAPGKGIAPADASVDEIESDLGFQNSTSEHLYANHGMAGGRASLRPL